MRLIPTAIREMDVETSNLDSRALAYIDLGLTAHHGPSISSLGLAHLDLGLPGWLTTLNPCSSPQVWTRNSYQAISTVAFWFADVCFESLGSATTVQIFRGGETQRILHNIFTLQANHSPGLAKAVSGGKTISHPHFFKVAACSLIMEEQHSFFEICDRNNLPTR
ncbi:hypothetical protein K439DRAFT_403797 [Ramaria rubella]|nr:hypothetical protein K439DRAFT_403797 [Ramaria rubella]